MEELIEKAIPGENDFYTNHKRSLKRIAKEVGIPIKSELKYSVWELEDLIIKAIHIKVIQGKNLKKRLNLLEKQLNSEIGFWKDGTIGGRSYE